MVLQYLTIYTFQKYEFFSVITVNLIKAVPSPAFQKEKITWIHEKATEKTDRVIFPYNYDISNAFITSPTIRLLIL